MQQPLQDRRALIGGCRAPRLQVSKRFAGSSGISQRLHDRPVPIHYHSRRPTSIQLSLAASDEVVQSTQIVEGQQKSASQVAGLQIAWVQRKSERGICQCRLVGAAMRLEPGLGGQNRSQQNGSGRTVKVGRQTS